MYDHEIIAFFPFYDKEGNDYTRVYLNDGTVKVYTEPIQSFIRNWLACYHLDLNTLRLYAARLIHKKIHIPLLLHPDKFYLPVKLRTNLGKYTLGYGYILRTETHGFTYYWQYLNEEDRNTVKSQLNYIRRQEQAGLVLAYDHYRYGHHLSFLREPARPL